MEHIPKKSHYARCPALELLCYSLFDPLPKILESPGLYEFDRQSQTRRRGCFILRPTKQERKSALKRLSYCVSQDAQSSVPRVSTTISQGLY